MNRATLIAGGVALILSAGAGYWFGQSRIASNTSGEGAAPTERKPLYYQSPMNPTATSPVPAKDAMGMDFVPVFADDADSNELVGTVNIDPVVQQNIGLRTAKAQLESLSLRVRAVGRIAFDERRITQLHPKIEGWIENLMVDTTGQQVEKDAILLSLYSPRLVASQEEYVLALKYLETLKKSPLEDIRRGALDLAESSRARLRLFDVPEHQIRELESTLTPKKSLHIHSPAAGIVTRIGAREGQHVSPNTELFAIADLSRVWVYVDIYEYELPWVKVGDVAEMTLAASPGRVFSGRVVYIYPYAETKTRTVKIRLEFENPDLALKPEMYAEVNVLASDQEAATVIPAEAVVRSGSEDRVFVVRAPGKFEPRKVRLGIQSNGRVIVLAGIEPGDEVVTSAQFLIDSESSLREATNKMRALQPEEAQDEPPAAAAGMDMSGEAAPEMDQPR